MCKVLVVLILLLLDIPFWALFFERRGRGMVVLILLLLDIPFWEGSRLTDSRGIPGLNPSSAGYSFLRTYRRDGDKGFLVVLILLLLDIPFWERPPGLRRKNGKSLNPSSAGYSFLSMSRSLRPASLLMRLNPSSAGYSFLSTKAWPAQMLKTSLNPSSAGYSFLREELMIELGDNPVLILLLLDIPFWDFGGFGFRWFESKS